MNKQEIVVELLKGLMFQGNINVLSSSEELQKCVELCNSLADSVVSLA